MAPAHIIKEISENEFRELISKYPIRISPHTYFRIDEGQRKVYKDEYLIQILTREQPARIGLQENGRYAAFFRRKEGYLRIIFQLTLEYIEIKTFYVTESIPRI